MTKTGTKKPANEAALIACLASGANYTEAAKKSGISARTISRRMSNPEFQEKVSDTRRSALIRAVGAISTAASRAVLTLNELLGAKHPPSIRLAAARAVLENVVRLTQHADLDHRLAALEATAAELDTKGRHS